MKIIFIDGEKIKKPADFYRAVRESLGTDDLIGDNLDALWDVLSTVAYPLGIVLVNTESLRAVRGIRWRGLCRLLEDLTEKRKNIAVLVDPFGTDPALGGSFDD